MGTDPAAGSCWPARSDQRGAALLELLAPRPTIPRLARCRHLGHQGCRRAILQNLMGGDDQRRIRAVSILADLVVETSFPWAASGLASFNMPEVAAGPRGPWQLTPRTFEHRARIPFPSGRAPVAMQGQALALARAFSSTSFREGFPSQARVAGRLQTVSAVLEQPPVLMDKGWGAARRLVRNAVDYLLGAGTGCC